MLDAFRDSTLLKASAGLQEVVLHFLNAAGDVLEIVLPAPSH